MKKALLFIFHVIIIAIFGIISILITKFFTSDQYTIGEISGLTMGIVSCFSSQILYK